MGVRHVGTHSSWAVYRNKELLLHIFWIVSIISPRSLTSKKRYFLCTASAKANKPTTSAPLKTPQNSQQSSQPSCCVTSVRVHELMDSSLCPPGEQNTRCCGGFSTQVNCIKEKKLLSSSRNKQQQKQKIPATFPIDSVPQANHSKNQSIAVNRQV